jgi:serine/threonine-protein kinase
MLYELLAGVRPYEGNSVTAVLLRAARGEHTPLRSVRPEVPAALAEAIAKAMSPRAEDRFQQVGAFIDAIQPFAAAEGLEPSDADTPPAADGATVSTPFAVASHRSARGSRLLARPLLWLILTAALVAFGLFRLRDGSSPQHEPVVPVSTPPTAAVPPPTAEPTAAAAPAPPSSSPRADQTAGSLSPRPVTSLAKPKPSRPPAPQPSAKVPTAGDPADPATTDPSSPPRGRLGVGFGRGDF